MCHRCLWWYIWLLWHFFVWNPFFHMGHNSFKVDVESSWRSHDLMISTKDLAASQQKVSSMPDINILQASPIWPWFFDGRHPQTILLMVQKSGYILYIYIYNQLRLVVFFPIIYWLFYTSQVVGWDFWTINCKSTTAHLYTRSIISIHT